MAETTDRGIRYPLGGEVPAFPDDFRALADGVDDLVPRVASGTTHIKPSGDMTDKDVKFPDGLFTSSDSIHVFASGHSAAPGNSFKNVRASDGSPSGATIRLNRTNNASTLIDWIAVADGGGVNQQGYELPQYEGSKNTRARPTRYLNSLQKAVRAGLIRVDAGKAEFDNLVANEPRMKHVDYKAGLFDKSPILLLAMQSEQAGSIALGTSYLGDGSKGADIYFQRTNTTNTYVHWIAIQETSKAKLWTPGGPADLAGIQQDFAEHAEDAIPRIDIGVADISPKANEPTFQHVEFEPGLFSGPPIMGVTTPSSSGALSNVGVKNITATGADIVGTRSNDTSYRIRWIAVQP